MMSGPELAELRKLAALYGVLTEFIDSIGRLQVAEPVTILGVLRAMGVPVEGPAGVAEAIRLSSCRRSDLAAKIVAASVASSLLQSPPAVQVCNPEQSVAR